MPKRTAILGWGSLLWDEDRDFDSQHYDWQFDGPRLKLEFSRASKKRFGALTLVIDETNGEKCTVAYAMSKRSDPVVAVSDLQRREGAPKNCIGCISVHTPHPQYEDRPAKVIREWAKRKKLDVVVWTDLQSNFEEACRTPFSVTAGVAHVKGLTGKGKNEAMSYVWRAPSFVNTPLRQALQRQPWFPPPPDLIEAGSKAFRGNEKRDAM